MKLKSKHIVVIIIPTTPIEYKTMTEISWKLETTSSEMPSGGGAQIPSTSVNINKINS